MTLLEKPWERPLGVAAGALCVGIGAALPWGGSGQRDRSSFEIVQVADTFEVLSGPLATAARLWLLLPLLVALVLVAVVLDRRMFATVLGTVLAVAGVGLLVAVSASPFVTPRVGMHVTMVGIPLTVADAARQVILRSGTGVPVQRRRERRLQQ